MATTVGLVGLGLLGHAVASRLTAAGGAYDVVGYDVVPERVAALERLGGRAAPSAAAVAAAAEAICVVLPSLAAVEEVILGVDGLIARGRTGQTIIQMSTISPTLTRRLAREVNGRGRHFLDCPISGTSAMVARGNGVVFVGGDLAIFERWRGVLDAVLPRPVYVGEAGQAMVLKLVANLLVALHSAAAAEALTMARRAGLDLDLVLDVLGSGAAGSRIPRADEARLVHEGPPPHPGGGGRSGGAAAAHGHRGAALCARPRRRPRRRGSRGRGDGARALARRICERATRAPNGDTAGGGRTASSDHSRASTTR
jgi:putative dehydrogenase